VTTLERALLNYRLRFDRLGEGQQRRSMESLTVGARIAAEADAGEVLVSGTVRDLVAGSGLDF